MSPMRESETQRIVETVKTTSRTEASEFVSSSDCKRPSHRDASQKPDHCLEPVPVRMRTKMQARAQCNHYRNPHKERRANAREISHPEMRQNCGQKVQGQADTGDNAQKRPKNSQNQTQSASQFTSCKNRKVTEGKAHDFVNCSYYTRVMANLRHG